jgi:hypothetical protein
MVNIERMEESEATSTTITTHQSGDFSGETVESEDERKVVIHFKAFPVTPTLDDVRKELKGTKKEPLSNVIVSHPTYMKDVILEQGTKMLNLYLRSRQKNEAQLKQETTTGDQTSYIPGSLRIGNPIKVPNYLKGSNTLQEIVERGHEANEARKETFAAIALDMTRAVIEETNVQLQVAFFDAVGELSELLVVAWESCAEDTVEYEHSNSSEFLASYAAIKFFHDHMDRDMQRALKFEDNDKAARAYRKYFKIPTLSVILKKICPIADALTDKVSDSLGEVMEETTVKLWDFHRQKERDRIMKAKMTAIKEKHEAKRKNEEMQARIAKEEREDREAAERGELPRRMIDQMKKYAKAEAKALMDEHRKNERVKGSGDRKNQRSKPTKNGPKSKSNSGRSSEQSTNSSSQSSTNQRGRQRNASARSTTNNGRGNAGGRNKRSKSKSNSKKTSNETSSNESNERSQRSRSPRGRGGRGRGGRGGRGGRPNAKGRGRGRRN